MSYAGSIPTGHGPDGATEGDGISIRARGEDAIKQPRFATKEMGPTSHAHSIYGVGAGTYIHK